MSFGFGLIPEMGLLFLFCEFIWDGILSTADDINKTLINTKCWRCYAVWSLIQPRFIILCMCCCVCAGTCTHVSREQRLVLGVSLRHSPSSFLSQGARVCHWAWRSWVWQDCLVCKSLGPTFPHLLNFGDIAMYYHAWLFRGCLG